MSALLESVQTNSISLATNDVGTSERLEEVMREKSKELRNKRSFCFEAAIVSKKLYRAADRLRSWSSAIQRRRDTPRKGSVMWAQFRAQWVLEDAQELFADAEALLGNNNE